MPATDIELVDFAQVIEESTDEVRFSNDQSEFFVKFDIPENNPEFVPTFFEPWSHKLMPHEEILEYINNQKWIPEYPEFPVE